MFVVNRKPTSRDVAHENDDAGGQANQDAREVFSIIVSRRTFSVDIGLPK
jgi:hypothetical protein